MSVPQRCVQGMLLPSQHCFSAVEGAGKCHRDACRAMCCPLNRVFRPLRVQGCATEVRAGQCVAPSASVVEGSPEGVDAGWTGKALREKRDNITQIVC